MKKWKNRQIGSSSSEKRRPIGKPSWNCAREKKIFALARTFQLRRSPKISQFRKPKSSSKVSAPRYISDLMTHFNVCKKLLKNKFFSIRKIRIMITVRNLRNQHLQIKMLFSLTTNNIYVVINAQETEQKKLEKLLSI